MGICGSSAPPISAEEAIQHKKEQEQSQMIDFLNEKEHKKDRAIKKLLLLGAGESGKSTLFKQMIQIYGKGYDAVEERSPFTKTVWNNTIANTKALIEAAYNLATTQPNLETMPSQRIEQHCQYMQSLNPNAMITPEVAQCIKAIWNDNGIQNTYNNRSKFQLHDSCKYFFDRLDDMSQSGYVPSTQDILRTRVRTTGIVETSFVIDNNSFMMFDVGGQRNERKKWIHCFENVTAVIFVAAISEYDQVLFEDDTTNRMDEALKLFDEICNSRWFQYTSMILFLNKRDIFYDKICTVPLTVWAQEYTGPNDYEAACAYIEHCFISCNRSPNKEIYVHVTCATDTGNIQHVFISVKDIIIKRSLRDGGLL